MLTGGKTYEDQDDRFSFSVPTDWVRGNAGNAEVAFSPPDDSATFTVTLDRVSGNTTLDAYNQSYDRLLRLQFPLYTLVSLDKVMVGDRDAYRRVSRSFYQGQNIQFVQVYFIANNTAHILTSVCLRDDFDRYVTTFDGVSGSYKAED